MHVSIVNLKCTTEMPPVHACLMQIRKGNATYIDQYKRKKILIPSDAVKKCTRRAQHTIKNHATFLTGCD